MTLRVANTAAAKSVNVTETEATIRVLDSIGKRWQTRWHNEWAVRIGKALNGKTLVTYIINFDDMFHIVGASGISIPSMKIMVYARGSRGMEMLERLVERHPTVANLLARPLND